MYIHLVWLQGWEYAPLRIQQRLERNRKAWASAGLQVRLWDERGIVDLIPTLDMRKWFVSLQTTIAKCDIGRAIVLNQLGGLYADADFDPNPNGIRQFVAEGLSKKLPLFPADPAFGVNNFLIFSPPRAPFWDLYFQKCAQAITSPAVHDVLMAMIRPTWPVLSSHGPVLISRLLSTRAFQASSLALQDLGTHGWTDGEKDSSWYRTAPERLQKKVALLVLILALIGVTALLVLGANVFFRCTCYD